MNTEHMLQKTGRVGRPHWLTSLRSAFMFDVNALQLTANMRLKTVQRGDPGTRGLVVVALLPFLSPPVAACERFSHPGRAATVEGCDGRTSRVVSLHESPKADWEECAGVMPWLFLSFAV